MTYIHTTTSTYPLTLRDIRAAHPATSFPRDASSEALADLGYAPVTVADKPDAPAGQIAVQDAAPTETPEGWVLGWTVRDRTPEEAAEALTRRQNVARNECRRRIYAVADAEAQINLAAAAAAGLLTAEQMAVYQSGLAWVAQMRAAWEPMAAAGGDPLDDASWPAVPAGVVDLAAAF